MIIFFRFFSTFISMLLRGEPSGLPKKHYNIASRATQSNSVYVSVLQISTVLADGVSKSLCQNFFSRERPFVSAGKNIIFRYNDG